MYAAQARRSSGNEPIQALLSPVVILLSLFTVIDMQHPVAARVFVMLGFHCDDDSQLQKKEAKDEINAHVQTCTNQARHIRVPEM